MEPCWHMFDMAVLLWSACIKLALSVCVCVFVCCYMTAGMLTRPEDIHMWYEVMWDESSAFFLSSSCLNDLETQWVTSVLQQMSWMKSALNAEHVQTELELTLLFLSLSFSTRQHSSWNFWKFHRQHFQTRFICFDFKAPKLMPVGLIEINFQPWN